MINWLKKYNKNTSVGIPFEQNEAEKLLTDSVKIGEDVIASTSTPELKSVCVSKSSDISASFGRNEDHGRLSAERVQSAEDFVVLTSELHPVSRANVIPMEEIDRELTAEKLQENVIFKKRRRNDDDKEGKRKGELKTKRYYKFNETWLKDDAFKGWLKKSTDIKNGHDTAMCSSCNQTLLAHKGDIVRHFKSERHKNVWKQVCSSHKISEFAPSLIFSDSVAGAELKLSALLASNNLPFSLIDTLGPLCSNIFPDSNIAKNLAVKRTKATGLVKNVMFKNFAAELETMIRPKGIFFSIIMDETIDKSITKQCSLTVILFNRNNKLVETHFLDMVELPSSTANELLNCLKNVLSTKNIPLCNLIGFSSDTCNVMTGENNSVFALLKKELPNIACIKCSCHMINLSANKACLKLPRYVEDLIRNLGSHFSRSSKRLDRFKEFQQFFQIDIHRILTMSQTRWLSVKACVDRILEQYDPLEAYLRQTVFEDPSKTTEDMLSTMSNKYTKIYLEFMSYVLGLTTEFNILFQSETPLLHRLKPEVEKLSVDKIYVWVSRPLQVFKT